MNATIALTLALAAGGCSAECFARAAWADPDGSVVLPPAHNGVITPPARGDAITPPGHGGAVAHSAPQVDPNMPVVRPDVPTRTPVIHPSAPSTGSGVVQPR